MHSDRAVISFDIFHSIFQVQDIDTIDVIVFGGLGDHSLSRGNLDEELLQIAHVMNEARNRRIPVLGVCFGAQIVVQVFGGRVELDASR